MNNGFIWLIIFLMFLFIGLFGCSNNEPNKIVLDKSNVYCKIISSERIEARYGTILIKRKELCSYMSSYTIDGKQFEEQQQLKKLVETQ